MNILKQAFEFLNKPFQEKYNKRAQAYLDQFKKSYEDRTVAEKVLTECLYKVEVAQPMGQALTRYLGAMEAALVIEGHLEYGKQFDLQKNETYHKVIVRNTKEYLTNKGVL